MIRAGEALILSGDEVRALGDGMMILGDCTGRYVPKEVAAHMTNAQLNALGCVWDAMRALENADDAA